MPTPMKFIGAHPALDFVNTVGGWPAGTAVEDKLENLEDLIRWGKLAKLVEPADVTSSIRLARRQPRPAAHVLARARSLRDVLYRLFNCYLENRNPAPADLKAFQDQLRIARRHQMFSMSRKTTSVVGLSVNPMFPGIVAPAATSRARVSRWMRV